jgi:predicted DNA-binding transcriptional regulator AlpA
MRNQGEDLITTAQVAELLGITVAWANKLAAADRLPVAQKLPGQTGAYLFCREDIDTEVRRRTSTAA